MEKCAQKTADHIYFDLTEQIIETANTAINFYFKRPTRQSLVYVEDTIFDLVPFAEITQKSRLGQKLVFALKERLQAIHSGAAITKIDKFDLLATFPTEA